MSMLPVDISSFIIYKRIYELQKKDDHKYHGSDNTHTHFFYENFNKKIKYFSMKFNTILDS